MDTDTFASFNPTANPDVAIIKGKTDELIAIARSIGNENATPDCKRRVAVAITNYEQAAMWLVKAVFS